MRQMLKVSSLSVMSALLLLTVLSTSLIVTTRLTSAFLPTGIPAPTIIAPADGATGVSIRPTFKWTAVPDATSYHLVLAEDRDVGTAPSYGSVTFIV